MELHSAEPHFGNSVEVVVLLEQAEQQLYHLAVAEAVAKTTNSGNEFNSMFNINFASKN